MADEPDGINEVFQTSTRIALTAGGLVAERIIREREHQYREAQAASEQQAREVYRRLDAQRKVAVAALRPMNQRGWWDRASAEEIGTMWQTANAWSREPHEHPAAVCEVERMRDELRRRYAIDADSLDAEPAAVQDALERRERALGLAEQAREQARADEAVAAPLLVSAAHANREQEARIRAGVDGSDERQADVLYDSAERRRQLAAELEGVADQEAIQARVIADTNQAQPPEQAVANAPRRAPTGRRARGRAGQAREQLRRFGRGR